MRLSDIRFHPAAPDLRSTGLRGWVRVTLGSDWVLESIAVRRAASGRYVLAFPTRRDRKGEEHAYYRPTGAGVRKAIEDAVIAELTKRGFLT